MMRAGAERSELPLGDPLTKDMVWIPRSGFRMASDQHCPEEAPAHRVTDGLWIGRTAVANRQLKAFVEVGGHVTTLEMPSQIRNPRKNIVRVLCRQPSPVSSST